ncbi:MAG: metal ABC transporter substrate-binding protein [Planctomycetota bacterium]
MRTQIFTRIAAVVATCTLSAAAPADRLRVVATIPDLADIVREIGGERVEVTAITKGRENLHAVSTRPSHLIAMSRADVFVQIGLSLESAFVPGLLEGARNPKIQPGSAGFVSCSEGWTALDVPTTVSRKAGDVHPHGNPHLNLDPRGGKHIAACVLAGLCRVDPTSADAYRARHEAYGKRLDEATARWTQLGASWRDRKLVVYHQEYSYFATAYGLAIAGTIEDRPGIPPTPNHLAALIETMKREHVHVIATASWSNRSEVAEVARAASAQVAELPNQCGGLPGTETWIGMMDVLHRRIVEAFRAAEAH